MYRQLNLLLTLTLAFFCTAINAQSPPTRGDTILLSVHNNGLKFRLTPANFGVAVPQEDLLAEMYIAQDTALSITNSTSDTGRSSKKLVIEHKCDRLFGIVKDNFVLVHFNMICDATQVAFLAQRLGAKGIIFIHPNNNRDSIRLQGGVYKDSIHIPCYSVRRDLGAMLTRMLPSKVGIKKPDIMPDDALGRIGQSTNPNGVPPLSSIEKLSANSDIDTLTNYATNKNLNNNNLSIQIYPNPSTGIVFIAYSLSKDEDVKIDILTASGQLILTKRIQSSLKGNLNIDMSDYAAGVYLFRITHANGVSIQKIILQQ